MSILVILFMFVLFGTTAASILFYTRARKMEREQLPPGYGGGAGGGGFTPAGQLPGPSSNNNLMNLKINDIVSYFGTDYMIEGRLNYWEDGYTWVTYMLVDGDDVMWLSVEEDDRLEVSMWQEVKDLRLSAPLPEFVDYNGERYRMIEKGTARVNQQGKTGSKTGLQMEYFEYESDAGDGLSVEKWGSSIEASIGNEINPVSLDIFPGDEVGADY